MESLEKLKENLYTQRLSSDARLKCYVENRSYSKRLQAAIAGLYDSYAKQIESIKQLQAEGKVDTIDVAVFKNKIIPKTRFLDAFLQEYASINTSVYRLGEITGTYGDIADTHKIENTIFKTGPLNAASLFRFKKLGKMIMESYEDENKEQIDELLKKDPTIIKHLVSGNKKENQETKERRTLLKETAKKGKF